MSMSVLALFNVAVLVLSAAGFALTNLVERD